MKGKVGTVAFVVFILFSVAVAQEKDKAGFAGTWNQNLEKSTTKSSWLKSYVNKVKFEGDKLTITTTTVGDRGERSYDRTYTLGKPETSQDRDGDQFTTTVQLQGRTLVFDVVEKEHDATLTTHEVWTLSEDGKTMTKVLKHSGGPRGDSEQQYFFEKQSSPTSGQ